MEHEFLHHLQSSVQIVQGMLETRGLRDVSSEGHWCIRALGVHALFIVVHFCVLDVHLPGMKERNGTVRNITMQSDRKLRKKVKEKVLSNAENRLHLPTQRVQFCAQYKMGKNVSEYKKSLWVF